MWLNVVFFKVLSSMYEQPIYDKDKVYILLLEINNMKENI